MAIITRASKGSALTHTEMDTNLKQIPNGANSAITDTGTNVGIGTSSPSNKLTVNATTTDFISLFSNSTSSGNGLKIQAGDNAGDRILQLNDKNGNEKARFLATGGITFNGDTSTANALDDYEEGTWTPNISGSGGQAITETTAVGYYTKIGNMVTAWFTVVCSSNVGDTNYQLLYGLPFTPNTYLGYGLTGYAYFKTGSGGAGVTASIKVNSSYSYIISVRDSSGTITTASSYDRIDGCCTYIVA